VVADGVAEMLEVGSGSRVTFTQPVSAAQTSTAAMSGEPLRAML
jgi:hypothetical protein